MFSMMMLIIMIINALFETPLKYTNDFYQVTIILKMSFFKTVKKDGSYRGFGYQSLKVSKYLNLFKNDFICIINF